MCEMSAENTNRLLEQLRLFEIAVVTGNLQSLESANDFEGIQNVMNSGNDDDKIIERLLDMCKHMINGDYDYVLTSNIICDVAIEQIGGKLLSDLLSDMFDSIQSTISSNKASSHVLQYILLFLGVSALEIFIQTNYTGPKLNATTLNSALQLHDYQAHALKQLSQHEAIYHNVKCPEILVLSKFFLSSVTDAVICTKSWWMLRSLMVHQQILLEKSTELYDQMKSAISETTSYLDYFSSEARVQLNIESGLMHLFYHEITPAKDYFNKAMDIVGLNIELSGAFGKRTQFQSKPVAQLYAKVLQKSDLKYDREENFTNFLPKDLALEDDVLLNKVKFIDNEAKEVRMLLPEEQIAMLAQCCLMQKSNPSDELLSEQIMAYLDCLLAQHSVWSIQVKSLIMRSKLEKHKSRKVERAMMQMESLCTAIQNEEPDVMVRHFMFYSTLLPPYWNVEKELADMLVSLGAVKSALEIYLRLELWEDIVSCYQILEQNDKAAAIVKQQLAENETPLLWCILGDVTNDIQHYHKAWELSEHRSARAQRSLGYFYYKQKDYEKAIPYFEASLNINHLQLNVWFSLAFAAMQTKNYDLASKAYRHVVVMDPDNFEAWNNLSNAYIRLNQKVRAYRTLQEALKCNYEHWKIWENYLLVCMDVGAFEDGIHAMHRLLDIKGKYEDTEVLAILVKAITTSVLDINGKHAYLLKPKALQLFGRLTSITTNNSDIWKQYALLHSSDPESSSNKDTMERIVSYRQKAHKFAVQQPNWEKNISSCEKIIFDTVELGDIYFTYLQMLEGGVKLQGKSSAKLMIKNVIVRVQKQLRDYQGEEADELDRHLESLQKVLANIESL